MVGDPAAIGGPERWRGDSLALDGYSGTANREEAGIRSEHDSSGGGGGAAEQRVQGDDVKEEKARDTT